MPHQEKSKNKYLMCWRQCWSSEVHISYTFWKYPKMSSYWKAINKMLCPVFKIHTPLNKERLLFAHTVFLKQRRDTGKCTKYKNNNKSKNQSPENGSIQYQLQLKISMILLSKCLRWKISLKKANSTKFGSN